MRAYLRKIDTNTSGNRYDVTPLLADPNSISSLIADLTSLYRNFIDLVAGIDALGFILGTARIRELNIGLVPTRKGGKLPVAAHRTSFINYSGLACISREAAVQVC